MSKRKLLRLLYNILDKLKLRLFVQKLVLKVFVLEIEDEN